MKNIKKNKKINKKINATFILVLLMLFISGCGRHSIEDNIESNIENNSIADVTPEDAAENIEENATLEMTLGWTFLEGEGGWHQRITDEHIENAQYVHEQGIDSALNSHCVLLYKDEARDFALYYSFKSYQYDDTDDVLIISNGKRTVAEGHGDWCWTDLRETTSAFDIDNDGFEEIVATVVTGHGTGFLHTSFFVFDSSDGASYDMLSICGAEDIIYCNVNYGIKYLQDVSVTVDVSDGSVLFMQGNDVKYEGNIKDLIDSCPDITRARWGDWVSAEQTEDGKLMLISEPCFWGNAFVGGAYISPEDTENDVCKIIYEIEYLQDGTFKCVSVAFEKL